MYLNRATIIGNLTRDPEIRALPSGIQVATFGVATNRVWKDKDGAQKAGAQNQGADQQDPGTEKIDK